MQPRQATDQYSTCVCVVCPDRSELLCCLLSSMRCQVYLFYVSLLFVLMSSRCCPVSSGCPPRALHRAQMHSGCLNTIQASIMQQCMHAVPIAVMHHVKSLSEYFAWCGHCSHPTCCPLTSVTIHNEIIVSPCVLGGSLQLFTTHVNAGAQCLWYLTYFAILDILFHTAFLYCPGLPPPNLSNIFYNLIQNTCNCRSAVQPRSRAV